jgi:hypothetical protein
MTNKNSKMGGKSGFFEFFSRGMLVFEVKMGVGGLVCRAWVK